MTRPENYTERRAELAGWPVIITTYCLSGRWYSTITNIEPGAWVAKAQGSCQNEVELEVMRKAEALLAKTPRSAAPPSGCKDVQDA